MRFYSLTALCVVPVAFASTLQPAVKARSQESESLQVRGGMQGSSMSSEMESSSNEKSGNENNGYGSSSYGNANNIYVDQSQTDIILLWINEGGGSETKTVTQTVTSIVNGQVTAAAVSTAPGTGTTHMVTVGGTAGLLYTPDNIQAKIGDTVVFSFGSTNHTVSQAAFLTPCEKLEGGMDSGFMPNINNSMNPQPQVAMQVAVDTPIWLYCRQTGHCGKGMVMSINPTVNKTQAMFKQMALMQNGTGKSSPITGGTSSSDTSNSVSSGSSTSSVSGSVASVAPGSGSYNSEGGCSCLCGMANLPSALQGLNMFGGTPGSMPMSAMQKV